MAASPLDIGSAQTLLQQDFFRLFGLSARFQLDAALLDQRFRALQAQIHPDKFAHLSEAERRMSMQWATYVNEAYQTLRSPLGRARYLLKLHGVDTQEETNTAMPVDFLIEQMEWREAVQDARQAHEVAMLEGLESRLSHQTRVLQAQLADKIDVAQDYVAAAGDVRKLRFLEKLAEEIASAFDEIDT